MYTTGTFESVDEPTGPGLPASRTEWAINELGSRIMTGALRPGERLVSTALANELAISPTPLREALQHLAAEGLVELTSQRGARVAPLSAKELEEIYEIRMLLEPLALERSLRAADGGLITAAATALDQLRAALQADDVLGMLHAHQAFHEALLSRCDSTWLLRVVRLLARHSVRYRTGSRLSHGGKERIEREHVQLFELSRDGDVDGAVDACRQHLQVTVEVGLKRLADTSLEA